MSNTYSTLGGLFTAIANSIRQKTGGNQTIKADDFPTAISNIPSGSSLPTGIDGVWIGSYTPSEDIASTTGFTVTHNMGVVPDEIICWADSLPDTSVQNILSVVYTNKFKDLLTTNGITNINGYVAYTTSSQTYTGGTLSSSTYIGSQTSTTSTIKGNSSSRYFRSGIKYNILLVSTSSN